MKTFLIGVFTGIFVAVCLWLVFLMPEANMVDLGRLMDRDTIFMEDGTIIRGWVLQEDVNSVFIETKDSHMTIHPKSIRKIQRDVNKKYLRKLV
ncbi:MAG: hypothetical protein WCV56_05145 [Candidatus Omnitrophota bacterium]